MNNYIRILLCRVNSTPRIIFICLLNLYDNVINVNYYFLSGNNEAFLLHGGDHAADSSINHNDQAQSVLMSSAGLTTGHL